MKKQILLIPIILLSLVPVLWFIGHPGAILNGSDTNFPLNPLIWIARRFFVWDSFANAGQDFSSGISGLFFHTVQLIPHLLKINLQLTQLISLIFWFSMIIVSSYIFAKAIFPKNYWPRLIFVVLYSFNIYLFNTWEVAKVTNLSLVSSIPFALTVLVKLNNGSLDRLKAFVYSLLIGILLSGSGINPAYFLCFFIVLAIFFFAQVVVDIKKKVFRQQIKNFLSIIIPIVLINIFWIIPSLFYIGQSINPQGSINQIGYTNWIDSLSQNTSIFNIARLQGAWDWYSFDDTSKMPLYIPYALNYFVKLPFLVFSILIFSLAVISLALKNHDQNENQILKFSFLIMLVLGIFLGVGTHEPTGIFYEWISKHVPFFTLFRSPWYIFTPLTTISLAGLTAILFDRIPKVKVSAVLTVVLVVGNLVYCYPLVTGKIFRSSMPDNFYIKFPNYVFESFEYLNKLTLPGRIIGYPDDEIERFNWGYNGIDSILGLGTNKELLYSILNTGSSSMPSIISQYYLSLKRGEVISAGNIAAKLNASLLFRKQDQSTLALPLPEAVENLPKKAFGAWSFYEVPEQYLTQKVFIPKSFYYAHPFGGNEKVLSLLDKTSVLLNPNDTVVQQLPLVQSSNNNIVVATNEQYKDYLDFVNSASSLADRISNPDISRVEYSFRISSGGNFTPVLERFKLEDFGINPKNNLAVSIDGAAYSLNYLRMDDSYVYYRAVFLSEGEHKLLFRIENKNLVNGGDFENPLMLKIIGLGVVEIRTDGGNGNYVKIVNMGQENNEPGAVFEVNNFDPRVGYLINLRYRQTYGQMTAVGLSQYKETGMIRSYFERLPAYPDWQNYNFYFSPVVTSSKFEIKLISPVASRDFGTTVYYDDLYVSKVFLNNMFFVNEEYAPLTAIPDITFNKISPVKYVGEVNNANTSHIIVFSENYSPNWELSIWDELGNKVGYKPSHFNVNYYANGWYIEKGLEKYTFKITYKPQRYLIVGTVVSATTLLFGLICLVFRKKFKLR
jgi:hypothetical protein